MLEGYKRSIVLFNPGKYAIFVICAYDVQYARNSWSRIICANLYYSIDHYLSRCM